MADNTPTLHHLNNSQSQRILWLLEELNIPYNLVLHERNPPTHPTRPFLSPPSLVALGAYGKSPLLITGPASGSRSIPETSAIATYLIRTFDTADSFGLRSGDWIRDEILCSICATDLSKATSYIMMMDLGLIKCGISNKFDGPELRVILGEVERELREGPPGGYFMGENPGRADILLEFPLGSVRTRRVVDLKKEFPLLDEWLDRVYAREAWKRALEKGNGYDMSVFPMRPRS